MLNKFGNMEYRTSCENLDMSLRRKCKKNFKINVIFIVTKYN